MTEHAIQFEDGTTVDADVIVFATGFANDVRTQAAVLTGPEIGETLEDYFYVDEEGEILGAWKPQARECHSRSTRIPILSLSNNPL